VWRGIVEPLEDAESIYLVIGRDSVRRPTAFVRSPERNLGRYLGSMQVRCRSAGIQLVRGRDTLHASYDRNQGVLSLYLPTELGTFDLTRRRRDEASGFFPRTPAARYAYHPPIRRNDGWDTSSLTDVGLDSLPIVELVRQFVAESTASVTTPYVQAFLLARHGKLVVEEYFYGFHGDRVHDTRSAAKTITATLAGIAMQRAASLTLSTKVAPLFPEYGALQNDVPSKNAITVEHLLTMTSGLAADDDDGASPGTEDRLVGRADRYKFTLDLPMANVPGEKAVYSAAAMNLLGAVVQEVTHTWLPEFINEHFARPLDIQHYHVPLDPAGNAYMAGGILLPPRDFMKLGQLFLDGGRWRGRQIVSAEWARDATQAHATMQPGDYGYGWWLREVKVGQRTYHTFRAAGNGGQLLIVIPDLDLVALFMGGNYGQGPVWWRWNDELVPNVLIPAAVR
jgi:CubicO group peptidase (beta-lactamase class C family)